VEDHEIEALQRLMQSGVAAEPCPYLQTGQQVSIACGPLTGMQGLLLQAKGKQRLVVSITLLQRSVSVEVEQAWVKAAHPQKRPVAMAHAVRGEAVRARAAGAR
jgi:transcription antitermination factor NusG